jgi:hypothetical protein
MSELTFLIDEAVKSMEKHEGIRSALYLRAAHDYIHNIQSITLEVCLENYVPVTQLST